MVRKPEFHRTQTPVLDLVPTEQENLVPATGSVSPSAIFKTSRKESRYPKGLDWPVAGWMTLIHVGAIASFWYLSWSGLVLLLAFHFITACLGITLGFHRLLTHGSFETPSILKYFFSLCGMLSAEGSPLMWVSNHRKHHALSDREGDPHSPNDGFWWSHILWFHPRRTNEERIAQFERWAPDLYKDPVQRFFHKIFPIVSPISAILFYVAGEMAGGYGLSWLLMGVCLRTAICYHCTWFVNSATHVWGYRNYKTTDRSRNLWWVALLTYGEGWHNNHHAHQRSAPHGHRWYEFDVTYGVIQVLRTFGLAWNVQDKIPLHAK